MPGLPGPGPGRPADLPRPPHGRRHRAARPLRHVASSSAASCWARSASTRPPGSPFVWITQSLEAKHYANTQASFTYTHDSWEEITRERDRLFPDLDIVGWYHTHPSFGIFLSHHDLFIHQHFFAQPLQVAYVVDPIQQTRGFFQWRDGTMAQVEGFYLTAERGDRIALARLANDLENLPSPQGHGGGALSPRLEAELIKMLTRPSAPQYVGSPVDRLQIAAVFGMLGSFLGVLGVAAALWLYQLHGRIQEQGDSLKALAGSVDQVAGSQRLAIDTLLEKAGTENPAEFAERYERAAKARDEARRQLAAQQSINETLGARTKELEIQAAKLAAELETASKTRSSKYETDAKQAPELRERIAELEKAAGQAPARARREDRDRRDVEGQKAAEVLRRLEPLPLRRLHPRSLERCSWPRLSVIFTLRPLGEPDSEHPRRRAEPHRIT